MATSTLGRLIEGLLGSAFALRVLDDSKDWYIRVGYGLVGFDLLRSAWNGDPLLSGLPTAGLSKQGLGLPNLGRIGRMGKVAKLNFGETRVYTLTQRVQRISEQLAKGVRDPKVYGLARAVLSQRNSDGSWVVPEKDSLAEIRALFYAVKSRVRYTWDPMWYDAFQTPGKTLELGTGDCFVQGTKVLRDDHKLVPVESVREGDRIWGHQRWSTVTRVWGDKGTLKTWNVRLNNGSSMRLTPDHKVWVYRCKDGHQVAAVHGNCSCGLENRNLERIPLRELKIGDVLTQPDRIPFGGVRSGEKLLRVKEVIQDDVELPCFDIETDDHFVWLPEADWTVSQCDDMFALLGAMLVSVGYRVRARIVQTTGNDTWNHIYLLVEVPSTKQWVPLDLTVNQPMGWEVPKEYIIKVQDYNVSEKGNATATSQPTQTTSNPSEGAGASF